MKPISVRTLFHGLTGAERCPEGQTVDFITTDSREVQPGCVFVAFSGERFDGHDYAAQALEDGASYVVLNHPVEDVDEARTILCEDSYRAMMTMAANYRTTVSPKIVGVTGSVGKTTTKQMCYAALCGFGPTIKTEGNQNNELGVPRTLFSIDADTEYAVVEMGMNHSGEISRLTRCARPDVGIITCIGVSHIGNLGSRENICKAKLEICEGLPEGAPLVLNGDDAYLRAATLPSHVRPVWFSLEGADNADVWAENVRSAGDSTTFTLHDRVRGVFEVVLPALGRHNVANALAAYTAAVSLGVDAAGAAKGLESFKQTGRRQRIVHSKGVDVIEDCYNANPDSMKAALAMFRDYPCKGKRVALLADMLELGEQSQSAHEELGRQAAVSGIDTMITLGLGTTATCVAAHLANPAMLCIHAEDMSRAIHALVSVVRPGDALLVKGSHGMHLDMALLGFYQQQIE